MKITGILLLLLTATFLLSGCGHYGMGMGRHYYSGLHVNQNDRDLQALQGRNLMASVEYSR